jgi:type II secretory pathway component GspD/PulD (secretin)
LNATLISPHVVRFCLVVLLASATGAPVMAQPAATPPALESDQVSELTINGRRPLKGDPVALGFDNVSIEKTIPFIVESTGKVVIPQKSVLGKTITVINDQPIPRNEALDLLFMALQQADVAVVETDRVVSLRLIEEVDRQDVPVIGPAERVEHRRDLGNMYRKVFALSNGNAANVGEIIGDSIPPYSKLLVDEESNQIIMLGTVAMLQRYEKLIDSLDRPSAVQLETKTYRLRYADAELIVENIKELYSDDESSSGRSQNPRDRMAQIMMQRFQGRGGPGRAGTGTGA